MRRYLAEFLSDPRVIEIPRVAWQPILHGIILRTRPKKSAMPTSRSGPRKARRSPRSRAGRRGAAAAAWRGRHRRFAMRYGNPGHRPSVENLIARAASASSPRRSIRNIARRRRRPRTTRFRRAGEDAAAAGAPDACRPITTIRSTSTRCRQPRSGSSRRSISSRSGCCSASTACRSGRWSSAIPIIATARRPRDCSPSSWAAEVDVAFQSRFGRAKWLEPATERCSPLIRRRASSASPSPRPAFPPIAWRRSRSSASAAARHSSERRRITFARLDCLNDSAKACDAGRADPP